MLSATRLFPLLLLATLALLTFWLQRAVDVTPAGASLRRHVPDFIVDRFSVTNYNADGSAQSTLVAQRMTHFPDDDSTELIAPRFARTRPQEPRITLRSEHATLFGNGNEAILRDQVEVTREHGDDRPEMRVETSVLHFIEDRSLIRTDREVVIREPRRELRGRGMEYLNDTRQLKLHHDVRVRLVPAP